MKYYKIDFSLRKEEIGDYPQIQKFKIGYDSNRKESCSQIARYFFGRKPDIDIDFDGLELSNKGRLTDYVSASFLNPLTGLLISNSLYNFFSLLQMVDYISYRANIYRKGLEISNEYRWIHFIKSYPEAINFPESDFYLDHSEANFKKVNIASFNEFTNEQNKVNFKINSKKLVLNKKMVDKFDVLRIGVIKNETYVTESIKTEMVSRGFTGVVFESADYIILGE